MYVGPDLEDYQPLIDWGIFTEPIPGAAGRRMHYAQGKTLGVGEIHVRKMAESILTRYLHLGQLGTKSANIS
jgi:hypothetical protein